MNRYSRSGLLKASFAILAVVSLGACQKKSNLDEVSDKNLVTAGDPGVKKPLNDPSLEGKQPYVVAGSKALNLLDPKEARDILAKISVESGGQALALDEDKPTPPAATNPQSLYLGFPIGLLGEKQVFGAVITKVSDKDSEQLGGLKLTDLTPIHVRTVVAPVSDNEYVFALVGCAKDCNEASQDEPLITVPILGIDKDKSLVMLDLSPLGKELDLITMLDPLGQYTHLKAKTSETVSFDYSFSTLVFDVKTTMVPVDANPLDPNTKETSFVVRWYLRLASAFNPAFESRPAANGVGFFMTERSANSKIERHATTGLDGEVPVKYYIKNVPLEFQPHFAASFDRWNQEFEKLIGKKLLRYEFVNADDKRAPLLVPGDVRYHIVEWDLDNRAPYGGLGPSIANQFTGEILSSNVLIQGPHIVLIYKKWFETAQRLELLNSIGQVMEAQELELQAKRELGEMLEAAPIPKVTLTLGKKLAFRVTSQLPPLQDPIMQRDDFEELPVGYTFDTYMAGYFRDMVGHELGHNLGLRHNFRGNLGAADGLHEGQVSHSIMEYLGRNFRHLDSVGKYDVMAITYGYKGVQPLEKGLYCTDEDVVSPENLNGSPECSRNDATNDPFGYFENRLNRAVNLLIARGQKAAPVWTADDMASELDTYLSGVLFYAASKNVDHLTNFLGKAGRPLDPTGVKPYVLERLKGLLCDPSFQTELNMKENDQAKAKVQANLQALRSKAADLSKKLQAFEPASLACGG